MKKWIILASAAFVLAGCNQGGTLDDYGTGTDSGTSGTNINYQGTQGTNSVDSLNNQGSATSPGGMNSGTSTNMGNPGAQGF